ncbi:hypothetical protein [Streptomyces sp. NPDC006527]|uniref:hypothetical protein n=1 Tax=Streptomyces sp. NPDC006527 TaxID=3364749 RepID=UPI0036C2A5C1
MKSSTVQSGPVHLSVPKAPPEPVSGCRDCLHHAVRRANAVSAGDYSKATDVNVSLRAHLRDEHGAE